MPDRARKEGSAIKTGHAALREFAAGIQSRRRKPVALIRYLVSAVRRLPELQQAYRSIPRETVWVSQSTTGRYLASRIAPRLGGLQFPLGIARATLDIPEDASTYTRGKARQALRTNITHARRLEIICKGVTSPEERRAAVERFLLQRGWRPPATAEWERRNSISIEATHCYVAEKSGCVLALAILAVDTGTAVLLYSARQTENPDGSPARYLLQSYVVDQLSAQGVRKLFVGPTLLLADSLHYFQERVGFEPRNVRLRRSGI